MRGAERGFRALAKTGEPTAQHALGYLLADKSTPPRYEEAKRWYKRAVHNGNPLSAWNLALDCGARKQPRWQKYWLQVCLRMNRKGTIEDLTDWGDTLVDRRRYADAVMFFELAAQCGEVQAQNGLAILLETKIKPPRIREALAWYRKAVKRGSDVAAHNLSLHYRDNDDALQRRHWLKIAAKMGHSGAKKELRQLERPRRRG